MRSPAFLLALALASAPSALAQSRNLSEYHARPSSAPPKTDQELVAEARRAAGLQDLKPFGAAQAPKEKPFPFLAMGLALLAGLIASPFAYRMYKATRADLKDQRTFGRAGRAADGAPAASEEPEGPAPRISRRPPSREEGDTRIVSSAAGAKAAPPAASARDAVWEAISGARSWVTVEWVASEVGLSTAAVADEVGALATEGYLRQARDSAGRPVFRANG
jgi:hypothetical protein